MWLPVLTFYLLFIIVENANNDYDQNCLNEVIKDWQEEDQSSLDTCLQDCDLDSYENKISENKILDISQYIIQNTCFEDCSVQGNPSISLMEMYNCTNDNVYNRSAFNISACIKFQCQTQYFNYMEYFVYNVLLFKCSAQCDGINAAASQQIRNQKIDLCKTCLNNNIDNSYFKNSLGFNRLGKCVQACSLWEFDGIKFGNVRINQLTDQLKLSLNINKKNIFNQSIIWPVDMLSSKYVGFSDNLPFKISLFIIILMILL